MCCVWEMKRHFQRSAVDHCLTQNTYIVKQKNYCDVNDTKKKKKNKQPTKSSKSEVQVNL